MPALAGVAFLISLADGWAYRSLRVRLPHATSGTTHVGYECRAARLRGIVVNGSVNVFCTMLFVAIASRIYQPIVDRLNQLRA